MRLKNILAAVLMTASVMCVTGCLIEQCVIGNTNEIKEQTEEKVITATDLDAKEMEACTNENTYAVTKEEAGCTESGRDFIYCSDCGECLERVKTEALGHEYSNCYCIRCGTSIPVDEENHTIVLTRTQFESMAGYDPVNVVIPEVYYGAAASEIDGYTIAGLENGFLQYDTNVLSVSLPGTVTHIGQYSFNGCTNLQSVVLPEGLVEIRKGAFKDCTSLLSVDIPSTVQKLRTSCFDGCTGLVSVDLKEGLEEIGESAFQLCSSLAEISIPDSVSVIGNFAYNHCNSVENSVIELPSSLTLLGDDSRYPAHMFYDCGQAGVFTAFSISEENPYYETIDGILYTKGGETLVSIPVGKTFENGVYSMPDTVTNLGELSFSRNRNITTVVISDNLILTGSQPDEADAYLNDGNDLSIACYGYSGVTKYEVKETNQNYCSVDGILYSKDMSELAAIPTKYEGTIVIPEGVTSILNGALWENMSSYFDNDCFSMITGIYIPASLTNIPTGQIDEYNTLVDLYGLEISISADNPAYFVSEGHLALK